MPKRPRIAVVGSANVDLTTFTDRFPKPGETIFGQKFDLGFGGKGANQAVASKLCGAEVFMVARVGSDLFGPATIQNFKKLGIDATYVKQVEGVSSGVAPIFVESSGQNRIFVVKGANDELKPADVDAAAEMLQTVDCIVLPSFPTKVKLRRSPECLSGILTTRKSVRRSYWVTESAVSSSRSAPTARCWRAAMGWSICPPSR